MKILVVNCGSSSLKYQLFEMDTRTPVAKGLIEREPQPITEQRLVKSRVPRGQRHGGSIRIELSHFQIFEVGSFDGDDSSGCV